MSLPRGTVRNRKATAMDQALSLRPLPKTDGLGLCDWSDVPLRGGALDRRGQQFRKLTGRVSGLLPDLWQLSGVKATGCAREGLSYAESVRRSVADRGRRKCGACFRGAGTKLGARG